MRAQQSVETEQSGCHYSISLVPPNEWDAVLRLFSDASIYQSLSYGKVRWGLNHLRHYVLVNEGQPVAAAQVRVFGAAGVRVAYLAWGPMWRRTGTGCRPDVCAAFFHGLRDELVTKQGFWLRVLPRDEDSGNEALKERLIAEGFGWSATRYRTIVMDLRHSPEELRKSMRNTWRQSLAKAERAAPEVIEGASVALFHQAVDVYRQMHLRKGFARFVDMDEFARMQTDLPDELLMRVMVCKVEGEPAAALAWSEIGDAAIPTLAATGDKGLRSNALHYLYWRMIQRLQDRGVKSLDLGGVDKELNPGGYTWKTGLSGKLGREVGQLGQFDVCHRWVTRALVQLGDRCRHLVRQRKLRTASGRARREGDQS